jgi:16S rRNA (cytidine1402-2'-O)-methyltransferase
MSIASEPVVYLIPNTLGDDALERTLPSHDSAVVAALRHFLVEDEKSARKLIKLLVPAVQVRELHIAPLNKHTKPSEIEALIEPLRTGESIGIISDAGCPAIADPGADVVRRAHELSIKVVPLVGPCSVVLALMGSGLNGQTWRFAGYLPVDSAARIAAIRSLEGRVESLGETQIVMDTPYRTEKLFQDIVGVCKPDTRLCVAQGLATHSTRLSGLLLSGSGAIFLAPAEQNSLAVPTRKIG